MRIALPFVSRTRVRAVATAALAVATAGVLLVPSQASHAATTASEEGVVCENQLTAATATAAPTYATTINLDATDGYITTPDGNSIYMWGYGVTGRGFQLPGATLCTYAGQKLTVILHNKLKENVSIIWPGQGGVTADGAPAAPEFDTSVPPRLTSLTQSAAPLTGSVTYSFTPQNPGTYLYESGTDQAKQREMGLYGALIVRPADTTKWNCANTWNTSTVATGPSPKLEPDNCFSKDTAFPTEYLYMLSEIDPTMHLAVERGKGYDMTKVVPRYFLINGRSMPDTLAPNAAAWMPTQPYGALVHIRPTDDPDPANDKKPVLIRYLDAGAVNYPFHPHGSSQRVVGRDGQPVANSHNAQDASYLKFLLDVGPGQSVDALETWNAADANGGQGWDPATNPIQVPLPQLQDQIVGPGTETWFSESPYLGNVSSLTNIPNGMIQNNACGEYYQIAHSHALEQSTNYGASFGGMMTLIRIDPAGGCK